jgi:hypothetical protein
MVSLQLMVHQQVKAVLPTPVAVEVVVQLVMRSV